MRIEARTFLISKFPETKMKKKFDSFFGDFFANHCAIGKFLIIDRIVLCLNGMENSILVQIKQFPQPPPEPSDNSDSLSSGNGYKAIPVN